MRFVVFAPLYLFCLASSALLLGASAWVPPAAAGASGRRAAPCAAGSAGSSLASFRTRWQTTALPLSQLKHDGDIVQTPESEEVRAAGAAAAPEVGDVVTVSCRLVPAESFVPEPLIDGVVLSPDGDPQTLAFVLGRGNYLPGLHELVSTLREGESATGVPMDAGWGDRNPDLVARVTFESLKGLDRSQIKVGTQLQLANGVACAVTEVAEEGFTIDANPPLAGASYRADVTLLRVEAGPKAGPFADEGEADAFASRYGAATFALGCFWGGELEYMREPGVVGTQVGYTQGDVPRPTYEQVCTGATGHTEAIAVFFDPQAVSYERLVRLAMDRLGDNRYLKDQVGNDRGTQYRHGVYYHTPEQRRVAESIVGSFGSDCKTECLPAREFYPAEDYHQQYLLKKGQSARKGDDSVIRCYG